MHDFDLYRQIFIQSHWQVEQEGVEKSIAEWLFYPHSLTAKMRQHCQQLEVIVIQEQWQAVQFSLNFAKKEGNFTACWVREVLIKGDNQPWIFAQTILPKETVEKVAPNIQHLGNQAIGLWLFPQNPERQNLVWQYDQKTGCYARHSTFLLKGYPLIIQELFLPQFSFDEESS